MTSSPSYITMRKWINMINKDTRVFVKVYKEKQSQYWNIMNQDNVTHINQEGKTRTYLEKTSIQKLERKREDPSANHNHTRQEMDKTMIRITDVIKSTKNMEDWRIKIIEMLKRMDPSTKYKVKDKGIQVSNVPDQEKDDEETQVQLNNTTNKVRKIAFQVKGKDNN